MRSTQSDTLRLHDNLPLNWSSLFRYAQNLGFQLDAANCNQILVIPFFNNASYGTGGIFALNWGEVLCVIVNGIKAEGSLRMASGLPGTLYKFLR